MKKKVLITSALPYANGPLHFGHIAGAYLPGDCYARFQRLLGNEVLYICGSDEHGVAITLSAELERRAPQEHVDHYHQVIQKLFQTLSFSFDHYSRTTWKGHEEPTRAFFTDLQKNGYIEKRATEQLYSEETKRFYADRYVVGRCPKCGYEKARGDECPDCGASYEATDLIEPRSKMTGLPLSRKETTHWFLLLDQFKERLLDWIDKKDWKPNVVKFIKGYIEDMHPRAITRDSTWGISLPIEDTEGKVFYVWFDAPIGYISATKEWAATQGKPDLWKEWWLDSETELVQFIGKDNIPFHAAIFPAMLMGQDQPYKMVDQLPANEFYRLEGRKFSKSEGWSIDLDRFFTRYSIDQIRYMIAATAPETADSEFTWHEFQMRCNSELLGKWGNLVHRILTFACRHCGGVVPSRGSLSEREESFLEEVDGFVSQAKEAYANFRLRIVSRVMMELAHAGNVYFNEREPWKAAKQGEKTSLDTTIYCSLYCLQALALISYPVIPHAAGRVWHFLGYSTPLEEISWGVEGRKPLPEGQQLETPEVLFRKIEDEEMQEEVKRLHEMAKKEAASEETPPPFKDPISIEQVQQLDLRVATVLSAEPIKKSKKLYKVEVDVGVEKRTVVAGVRPFYSPEELVGRKVVLVANLQPAKLCGVESQGMLLAGGTETQLDLLSIKDLPNGAVVS